MSDFAALNTALSGLLAHRRALDVIGHNVANASTDGYSRRRVELTSVGAGAVPGVFSQTDRQIGGVTVAGVTRIRDEFLEARALRERAALGRQQVEAATLQGIERAVPEPSDLGIAAQMADLWAAWDDLANNPGDHSVRIALLEQAATVTSTLRRVATELTETRAATVREAGAAVAEVNALTARVAELNQRIGAATAAGLSPHDLSDQRDQLVMELGELVGVEVRAAEHGQVDVFLGGSALVRGDRAEQLAVAENGPLPGALAASGFQQVQVSWAIDGSPAILSAGRLAGLLDGVNGSLPQAMVDLDLVASRLVGDVNALHSTGHGLDAVNDVGLDFFDPAGVRASTIALSADVAGQPGRIAAALGTGGTLDAGLAQSIAGLATSNTGADAAYQAMIGRLAVATQAADRRALIQEEVVRQADDARMAVSGVSLDEELTNLVAEQRAYEAAARLLTTIDEALDVLINRTGVVGR